MVGPKRGENAGEMQMSDTNAVLPSIFRRGRTQEQNNRRKRGHRQLRRLNTEQTLLARFVRARFSLSRPAKGPKACLQAKTLRRLFHPGVVAMRPPAANAVTQAPEFSLGMRLVDVAEPIVGPWHGTGVKRRAAGTKNGRATPAPILGSTYQIGAHGVPLHVAQHREQVLVLLDGKGAKTSLPDVPGRVVVL